MADEQHPSHLSQEYKEMSMPIVLRLHQLVCPGTGHVESCDEIKELITVLVQLTLREGILAGRLEKEKEGQ